MKTYVITLSRSFLQGHPRAGKPTYFAAKFFKGQNMCRAEIDEEFGRLLFSKIHTIRGNYDLWAGRIKEVQESKAVLSIRQWSGKPYNSGQITIATLTAEHGVGVQKLAFDRDQFGSMRVDGKIAFSDINIIANNDGLRFEDFRDWFKKYDLTEPMAIIHFTKFRY